jgi:hypothetical protein
MAVAVKTLNSWSIEIVGSVTARVIDKPLQNEILIHGFAMADIPDGMGQLRSQDKNDNVPGLRWQSEFTGVQMPGPGM